MRVLGATLAALLLMATSASASMLSATYTPEGFHSPAVTAYVFNGVGNEQNDFTYRPGALYPTPFVLDTFTDGLNFITPVPGPNLSGGIRLVCTPTLLVVACVNGGAGVITLNAELGNGNDRGIVYVGLGTLDAKWDGGAGNDATGGGESNDWNLAGPGADQLRGGKGLDTADYSARTTRVEITLEGAANDGAAGEGDSVAPDHERVLVGSGGSRVVGSATVEDYFGGAGDDEFVGAPTSPGISRVEFRGEGGNDKLTGGGARDILKGGAGDDVLVGGEGADPLDGGPGNDDLTGGPGDDIVHSGSGTDVLRGNDGNDQMDAQVGAQTLDAGPGDDYIQVTNDGVVDHITCGTGNDRVQRFGIDPLDVIDADCEDVFLS